MRTLVTMLVLLGMVAGAGAWYWKTNARPHVEYRVSTVARGDMLASIEATGTLEPTEVVDVGAQVAGLIEQFGKDAVGHVIDYRSPVEVSMVLAQIDDAVYKADLNTANAQLDEAISAQKKGQADVKQAKAKQKQAAGNWARAQTLVKTEALSTSDYEMYQANFDTATADVAVAEAEVAQAEATIAAAKASLEKAQRNLDFCVIRSPVKGVIIDRRVNIGQTVVSSLDAPSLFLIAKDMSRMQVWVAVNEADIDHVQPGQKVTFTCDALEGDSFHGTVNKVRLNAAITQNVVTYTVEVDADNSSGRLLPYLTANVQFEVNRESNVLMVPNAALRWYPTDVSEVVPEARSQWKPLDTEDWESLPPEGAAQSLLKKKRDRNATIWLKEGALVRPVTIKLGLTDGVNTQIVSGNLKEGQELVTGDQVDTGSNSDDRDPFLPKMSQHR